MNAKDLIKFLKTFPSDTHIRTINKFENDDMPNEWVVDVREENRGTKYHAIILLTSE